MAAGYLVLAVIVSAVICLLLLLTHLTGDGKARFLLALASFVMLPPAIVAWAGAQLIQGVVALAVIYVIAFWLLLGRLHHPVHR